MPFEMLFSLETLSAVCTENHIDDNVWDEVGKSKSSEFNSFQGPRDPLREMLGVNDG